MSSMERLYQDKEWLYRMYRVKMLSTYQIAKKIGINSVSIQYWLRKLNIPIRSHSEANHLAQANHCDLTQEATEWLSGELLGDGCLKSQSSFSTNFSYSSKYPEYAQYISDTLKSFGIEQAGKINERYFKDRNCYAYNYQSRDYVELLPIRKRWYLEGKKVVPRNIKLTPLTLRQHYIGDGYLAHPLKRRPYIVLYTCGFSISDVNWLIEQVNSLGFKATKYSSRNSIYISTYSTKDFLNYIGKCPIKCYQYKWNYNEEDK